MRRWVAGVALLALAAQAGVADRATAVAAAEAALQRGDAAAAIVQLERAALMSHAADTEMRLVRAQLQSGEYRRALAFAAHTAGAHRDAPAAAALYAWLLAAGGQAAFAQRVLDEAAPTAGDDAVIAATRAALGRAGPALDPVLLEPPHRMAPYARVLGDAAPVPASTIVSSGMLLPGGQRAVAPLRAVEGLTMLWVRNGLGVTAVATVERRLPDEDLVVLRLAGVLDALDVPVAERDPFAGSPGHVVAYRHGAGADAAWPWLRAGFLGASRRGDAAQRRLGIDLAGLLSGGPVFDAAGRWTGLVAMGDDGEASLLTVARWRGAMATPPSANPPGPPPAALSSEQIYERALHVALQVIGAR
jgi:hypothetical protein